MEKTEIKKQIRLALERDGPLKEYLQIENLLGKYIRDLTSIIENKACIRGDTDIELIAFIERQIKSAYPLDLSSNFLSRERKVQWYARDVSKHSIIRKLQLSKKNK